MENKQLSVAQQEHLQSLVDTARNANAAVDTFIGYLREEHEAPDGKYEIRDLSVGFESIDSPNGVPEA